MVGEVNVDIYVHCREIGALPLRDFKIQACCFGSILKFEPACVKGYLTSEIYEDYKELHNYPPEYVGCMAYEVIPTRKIWTEKYF